MSYLDELQHLKLKSVRLVESNFETSPRVDLEKFSADSSNIQTRRWVEYDRDAPEITTVVWLGIRLIKSEEVTSEDPFAFYTLESKYALHFELSDHLEDEEKENFYERFFSKFFHTGPINIVWPFWREHIFSTLRSASLPMPEIALMPAVFKAETTEDNSDGENADGVNEEESRV